MIPTPAQLLSEIENGQIPLAAIFLAANCDLLLDKRDSDDSLDATYRAIWNLNEKRKTTLNRDPTEDIRKQSFLVVSNVTEQHEIASYVSDDFALIAWESLALVDESITKSGSQLPEWLYSQYKSGIFSCPSQGNGNSKPGG